MDSSRSSENNLCGSREQKRRGKGLARGSKSVQIVQHDMLEQMLVRESDK